MGTPGHQHQVELSSGFWGVGQRGRGLLRNTIPNTAGGVLYMVQSVDLVLFDLRGVLSLQLETECISAIFEAMQ